MTRPRRTETADRRKPRDGLHGERLARHFGIQATATASVGRRRASPLVFTRLVGQTSPETLSAPLLQEEAFSIVVQLAALPHHELNLAGRVTHSGGVPPGAVSAISLTDAPRSRMGGAFDALQVYVPNAFLDDVAREEGFVPPPGFSWPRAEPDPVALSLATLLLPEIQSPPSATSMIVEHLGLAFLAHAARRYGQASVRATPVASGLAPWQERRAKELMRARLATSLSITEVSRECRLSPSYFAAAFKRSTGRSPQQFLSELRVEEAKQLMLQTSLPLAEIALLCGFSDQSYFTRVFSNQLRVSPGQWRRARADPATMSAVA